MKFKDVQKLSKTDRAKKLKELKIELVKSKTGVWRRQVTKGGDLNFAEYGLKGLTKGWIKDRESCSRSLNEKRNQQRNERGLRESSL